MTLWNVYFLCPAARDKRSGLGFFFSPSFCCEFSLADEFVGGWVTDGMPNGLRSLLILSWFSFIFIASLWLVIWDDFCRPFMKINDDEGPVGRVSLRFGLWVLSGFCFCGTRLPSRAPSRRPPCHRRIGIPW